MPNRHESNRPSLATYTTCRSWLWGAATLSLCLTLNFSASAQNNSGNDLGAALMQAFENLNDTSGDSQKNATPMSQQQYDEVLNTLAGNAPDTPALPITDEQKNWWADFNHYVRIARPELAKASVDSLLGDASNQQLLDVIEASDYTDYERTLIRAAKVETLAETVKTLTQRIQQAKVDRARDQRRIATDIAVLAEGTRPNANATSRLAAAGQYAAPLLLNTLRDEKLQRLHPYVLAAMVSIGRPMVYPLSTAIADLEPVTQGQVAQALAEIGYPRTLPYLKAVIENPSTDPSAREKIQAAYDNLCKNIGLPNDVSAAELFLTLGENLYTTHTQGGLIAGFDAAINKGLVWQYTQDLGLVYVPVSAEIYGDVLARMAAARSLELNDTLDQALSLWLASNLRRENRLPADQSDPSYPSSLEPGAYYIKMSGPLRQHDVLERAINDHDADLALDAIAALRATAGVDALVNRPGAVQPLLRALSYPDRRVRFNAAFTLTLARPIESFPGSGRVVPVLAEAVRQTDEKYAMVIAEDLESLNVIKASLTELGYTAFGGLSLEDVTDEVTAGPGVDLILTNRDVDAIGNLLRQTAVHYKLGGVPVIAIVTPGEEIRLNHEFKNESRLQSTLDNGDQAALSSAVAQMTEQYVGNAIGSDEATKFAVEALSLLESVALMPADVYNVVDAQPALIQATQDSRDDVVNHAARVLALIDDLDAQSAIADAALNPTVDASLQILLLDSLAESAKRYGNSLNDVQLDNLLELVRISSGATAEAAAMAHGALTLPTSNVIELIAQ